MANRNGYLTVYSAERGEIYGEFADATWSIEKTSGGNNHVFVGTASEGTMETFTRIDSEGVDHVAFDFDTDGRRYSGSAQLLRPEEAHDASRAKIRIETGDEPAEN